jgi:hypothetical protein
MTRLDEAQDRLDRALTQLEDKAVQVSGSKTAARVEGELTTLRARCDGLGARNREVSDRLAVAISRIETILEDGDGAG